LRCQTGRQTDKCSSLSGLCLRGAWEGSAFFNVQKLVKPIKINDICNQLFEKVVVLGSDYKLHLRRERRMNIGCYTTNIGNPKLGFCFCLNF